MSARAAGGSLFDFETDARVRKITERIGADNPELAARIYERPASSISDQGTPMPK